VKFVPGKDFKTKV